jgi:hypothetical protein
MNALAIILFLLGQGKLWINSYMKTAKGLMWQCQALLSGSSSYCARCH